MLETRAQRVIALVVLLGALTGAMLQFGTVRPDPRMGYYPTGDQLAVDFDGHVGETVEVGGTVVETDPVVISVDYAGWDGDSYRRGVRRFRVSGIDRSVTPGQALQVYGTVHPDGTIRATESIVVPAGNLLYMYCVSFLAGLWVLIRLVRGWTVAWDELALRRRSRPSTVVEAIRRRLGRGRTVDA